MNDSWKQLMWMVVLPGCAAEADLSPSRGEMTSPLSDDAGIVETELSDASVAQGVSAAMWTVCDEASGVFERGVTGDTCSESFRPCGIRNGCVATTATCEGGRIWLSSISAPACDAPSEAAAGTALCEKVSEDPCCSSLFRCGEDQRVATACTLSCEALPPAAHSVLLTGCAELTPELTASTVVAGQPCTGPFVCPVLGSYGEVYWCGDGILHKAVSGPDFLADYLSTAP